MGESCVAFEVSHVWFDTCGDVDVVDVEIGLEEMVLLELEVMLVGMPLMMVKRFEIFFATWQSQE